MPAWPRGAGERYHRLRELSDRLPRFRVAMAPVGARRLADPALAVSLRTRPRRALAAQPVRLARPPHDIRKSAPPSDPLQHTRASIGRLVPAPWPPLHRKG